MIFGRMHAAERLFYRVNPVPCSSQAPHVSADCIRDAEISSSGYELGCVDDADARVRQQCDSDEVQRDRDEREVTG